MKLLFLFCILLIYSKAEESLSVSIEPTTDEAVSSTATNEVSSEPTKQDEQSQDDQENFTDSQFEDDHISNNDAAMESEENEPIHRDPSIVQNNFNVNESSAGLGHRLAESVFLVYTVGILTIASLILGLVILGILLGRLLKEERKIYVMPPPPPPTHNWKHQMDFDHQGYPMPPPSPNNKFENQVLHSTV